MYMWWHCFQLQGMWKQKSGLLVLTVWSFSCMYTAACFLSLFIFCTCMSREGQLGIKTIILHSFSLVKKWHHNCDIIVLCTKKTAYIKVHTTVSSLIAIISLDSWAHRTLGWRHKWVRFYVIVDLDNTYNNTLPESVFNNVYIIYIATLRQR